MSESWIKEYCPKCGTVNWINNGDETDLTVLDIEAIKCRKCNYIFWLGEEEDFKFCGYESIEDCYWEVGLEKPY